MTMSTCTHEGRPTLTLAAITLASIAGGAHAQCVLTADDRLDPTPDSVDNDSFGASVAVDGNAALVGAQGVDLSMIVGEPPLENAGAVHVFRFDGTGWVQETRLTASDAAEGEAFGRSVAISGDAALIGANQGYSQANDLGGSAYVFRFDGSGWSEEAKLTADDAMEGDRFGGSVSLDGDLAIIGALGDDDGDAISTGSAYVFRFDGSAWLQEARLTAEQPAQTEFFGYAVSISGDWALVGARGNDDACPPEDPTCNNGAAYFFHYDGTSWSQELKVDGAPDDGLGTAVCLAGDTAVLGTRRAPNPGLARVFRFDGTSWNEGTALTGDEPPFADGFGEAVSVSGETILVGATRLPSSAHLFELDGGGGWTRIGRFETDREDWGIGEAVSISGDLAVVGHDDDFAGVAYALDLADLPCLAACPEDVTFDGVVDVDDLVEVILAWGDCAGCAADLDDDGLVGVDDLVSVIVGWGPCR